VSGVDHQFDALLVDQSGDEQMIAEAPLQSAPANPSLAKKDLSELGSAGRALHQHEQKAGRWNPEKKPSCHSNWHGSTSAATATSSIRTKKHFLFGG
jgi:hypothetical protein